MKTAFKAVILPPATTIHQTDDTHVDCYVRIRLEIVRTVSTKISYSPKPSLVKVRYHMVTYESCAQMMLTLSAAWITSINFKGTP